MIKMMRSEYFDKVELIDSRDTLYDGEKAYSFSLSPTCSISRMRSCEPESPESGTVRFRHQSRDSELRKDVVWI